MVDLATGGAANYHIASPLASPAYLGPFCYLLPLLLLLILMLQLLFSLFVYFLLLQPQITLFLFFLAILLPLLLLLLLQLLLLVHPCRYGPQQAGRLPQAPGPGPGYCRAGVRGGGYLILHITCFQRILVVYTWLF